MIGLDQQGDVYAEDPVSGRYTVLVRSRLSCRLVHMPLRHVQTSTDRAQLAGMRNLIFDPDYMMPENCQVEVDDIRWQPSAGTFGAYRDWASNIAYRRCDAMRVQVNSF